jgi:DnaJ-class molecular chaperone
MEEKYYNAVFNKYIYINEGERLCPKCRGRGRVPRCGPWSQKYKVSYLRCDECLGDGKIDWIEDVVGKRKVINYYV